jgi:hypothetical protein
VAAGSMTVTGVTSRGGSSHAVLARPAARMANTAIGGDMYIWNSSAA